MVSSAYILLSPEPTCVILLGMLLLLLLGNSKRDRIRNEYIFCDKVGVASLEDKMQEARLR